MMSEWQAYLEARAEEWQLPTQGKWSVLFNNNYHPHCSTFNLFWFHNGSEFPRVVTKIFHAPEIPKREFDNLCRVYACAPDWIPRPLHFAVWGQYWMLWMEGVPGWQLRLDGGCRPSVLRSITAMVAAIHCGARKRDGEADPERHHLMVSEPLRAVAEFGGSAAVRTGCDRLAGQVSPRWIESLPVIPQHGDLFVSNVLSHRGRWHVIDWESFGAIDLPFYDLLTLLLSLLRGEGATPDKWKRSVVRQVPALIECYARAVGLCAADVMLLLPLTLANWFHLQWNDGRKEFAGFMYQTLEHYFEEPNTWEKVFVADNLRNR